MKLRPFRQQNSEIMTNNFWFCGELRWAMESFPRSHRHKPSGYNLWCKCPFTKENSYFLIINTQSWSSGHFGNKIAQFLRKISYILWCKCPFTKENSYFLIINIQSLSSGHFGNKIAHFYSKLANFVYININSNMKKLG